MNDEEYEHHVVKDNGSGKIFFWCSGCGEAHIMQTLDSGQSANHRFNGDFYRPTFVLESGAPYTVAHNDTKFCGFTISDGIIHYLPECTHHLRGMDVEMRERKDWGGIKFSPNGDGTFHYDIEI